MQLTEVTFSGILHSNKQSTVLITDGEGTTHENVGRIERSQREEFEPLNKKLAELTGEELKLVTGGTGIHTSNVCETTETTKAILKDADIDTSALDVVRQLYYNLFKHIISAKRA